MMRLAWPLLLLFTFESFASPFGSCIHDPRSTVLQEKWKLFFKLKKKQVYINSLVLVEQIRMDRDTYALLKSVSEVEELINLVEELERKYFKKAFVDLRFNEMVSHPNFMARLLLKEIDAEIRDSALKFRDDPKLYELLDKVRGELSKNEVSEALALFREKDLGILDLVYRKSAKSALRLIRKRGGSLEAVRSWENDPPYLRNVPYPGVQLGPFAVKYRSLVMSSVANFVTERKITLADAKKDNPRNTQLLVDEINNLTPPTETNSFDDHIGVLPPPPGSAFSRSEFNAVDGVVRTLWGEATSCQSQGLPQFEAIGRIIADRSLAVMRSLKEHSQLAQKAEEIRKENWVTVLKNWVGISRPAPGLKNKPFLKLRGLADFGRKEKADIHPAAQVISKKGQFSVWNSYSLKKFHTGQFHKNIPDAVYELQGPQAENDDKALVRILCPQIQTEDQKMLWEHALKISFEIVQRPLELQKKIVWPVRDEILFYTHEAPLPFAREVKVQYITDSGNKKFLRGKGRGPCHHFRLFSARFNGQY